MCARACACLGVPVRVYVGVCLCWGAFDRFRSWKGRKVLRSVLALFSQESSLLEFWRIVLCVCDGRGQGMGPWVRQDIARRTAMGPVGYEPV